MSSKAEIAIVGAGPAGLTLALALARRAMASGHDSSGGGIAVTVYDKQPSHFLAQRFDVDRSYTIDITGHGRKALEYVHATDVFDEALFEFKGLIYHHLPNVSFLPVNRIDAVTEESPGYTGSRGDICRALQQIIEEKFSGVVAFCWETGVSVESDDTGTLVEERTSGGRTVSTRSKAFDLIVGADGAGSVVRAAVERFDPTFYIQKRSTSKYCTMMELDKAETVGKELSPEWLQVFNVIPLSVAGAVGGGLGRGSARWFCQFGFTRDTIFSNVEEVKRHLRHCSPKLLDLVTDEEMEKFIERKCQHIGRSVSCNPLRSGRFVLLGDAACAFPPIGQGVNAAMESAMVLDQCIGRVWNSFTSGSEPATVVFCQALNDFDAEWRPSTDALVWLGDHLWSGNVMWMLCKGMFSSKLGLGVLSRSKDRTLSYYDVMTEAIAMEQRLRYTGWAKNRFGCVVLFALTAAEELL
eukprot:gene2623-3387_t